MTIAKSDERFQNCSTRVIPLRTGGNHSRSVGKSPKCQHQHQGSQVGSAGVFPHGRSRRIINQIFFRAGPRECQHSRAGKL